MPAAGLRKTLALMLIATGSVAAQAQTLTEAVDQTIKTNPQLLTQANRRLATDQDIDIARAGYYPKIDFMAGVGYEMSDNATTTPDDVEYRREESEITLRQMLYDGFATKSRVDSAHSRVAAAANRVASDSERLGLQAATAYLNMLKQTELVALSKQNLQAHQKTFDQIKKRSDQGFNTSVDMEQARGRLALAQSNYTAAEGNLLDARAEYVRVVGVAPENLSLPSGDCCSASMPATVEAAIEYACNRHPELLAAIAEYETRLAEEQGSKAQNHPLLHLDLGASWNENIDGVEGGNDDKYALVRGEYNIYRGGADKAKTLQSAHQSEESKEKVRVIKRSLDESVKITWNAMEISQKTQPILERRSVAAEKSRNAYYDQFIIGQRTLLDLLDSENELFSARSQVVEGRFDTLLSQYRLMAALGLLLKEMGIESREEALLTASDR